MKKMLFVFNPRSGKGLIRSALLDIVDIFTRGGFDVTCHPTQKPRDGYRKILEDGMDYDVVVVSGGDGTMSEAVTALMQLPEMIPVGYIPTGSTNDFAASLRIPTNTLAAAQDIVDGVYFEYDVGQFNRQRYFVYVAAFGIFTDVPYETPQDAKNIFGHAAYIAEGIKRFTLGSYKGMDITVEHDGITETGNFLLGIVSNSTSIGGMKVPMRDGVYFDDGLFEVTLVRTPTTPIALQQTLNDALLNRLTTKNFLSFKSAKVKFTSVEPIAWTLDGEAGGAYTESLAINCRRAIKLIIKPDDKTDQQQEIDSKTPAQPADTNNKYLHTALFEDQNGIEI